MTIPEIHTTAVSKGFIPEEMTVGSAHDEATAFAVIAEVAPQRLQAGWTHLTSQLVGRSDQTAFESCIHCAVDPVRPGSFRLDTRPKTLKTDDPRWTEALLISRFNALQQVFFHHTGWWPLWLAEGMVVFSRVPAEELPLDYWLVRHSVHLRWRDVRPEPAAWSPLESRAHVLTTLCQEAPDGLEWLRAFAHTWEANGRPANLLWEPPAPIHAQVVMWLGSFTARALLSELTGVPTWKLFHCCGVTPGEADGMLSFVRQLREQHPDRIAC